MYLSILEYALVRLGLAAVRLLLRAAGLLCLGVVWVSGVLMRLALRPLLREIANLLGRLRGHWALAKQRRHKTRRTHA